MTYDHEAEVAKFFASAKAVDPERYEAVCEKYPVQTERQIRYRRYREDRYEDQEGGEWIGYFTDPEGWYDFGGSLFDFSDE